ncbi:aminopeptidase [Vallitalea longa]|uniref:Aminopeptidase n=1 Tax=Vallitalea longa TaxID=2936439 RepID=A0A9W5YDI3_9FIRM|nr:M42 family metallopeptidase [Vallitalea longa]GKX30560.1 aminopeptidase [Vallitalea longa]
MDQYREYILDFLKKILETESPSGFCYNIMSIIEKEAEKMGCSMEFTNKGCGVIEIEGKSEEVLGLSAHVDTLGAMVRSIKSNGTIRLTSIGGYLMNSIEGEYCKIFTRDGKEYEGTILTTKPSVHVFSDASEHKRIEENMEVRIDENVSSKEDVEKLGIEVGNFIAFDPRVRITKSGYIKSRHLDDKAGIATIFGLMKYIKDNDIMPRNTLKIFISTYEEVGHGSSYIPQDITEMIAIDMGAMGDDLCCTEHDVSICVKDSSGPYDYNIINKLASIAKEKELGYALDVYPHYGSDVSASLRAGNNIRGALIGPGVHASHGMERTHIEGVLNTLKLLSEYVK